jgi:hypothetical protein
MATYDQLPVYKSTYDLLLSVFQICQNMERDIKFTIGEKLKNEIIELQINVFRANCREDKCTLYGVQQIAKYIKECSSNYTQDCYILKLDIKGYFMGKQFCLKFCPK